MKPSNPRSLIAALAGLALASITPVTATAGEPDGKQDPAFAKELSSKAPTALPRRQLASHGSPLTLFVQGPTGNVFRFVYVPDEGWRSVAGWSISRRTTNPRSEKVALTAAPAPAPEGATPEKDPLTLFIDGPTGFVFEWIPDTGWKFVGRLSDRHP